MMSKNVGEMHHVHPAAYHLWPIVGIALRSIRGQARLLRHVDVSPPLSVSARRQKMEDRERLVLDVEDVQDDEQKPRKHSSR